MSKLLQAAQTKAQSLEDALADARCRAAHTLEAHNAALKDVEVRHEATRAELKAVQSRMVTAEQATQHMRSELAAAEVKIRALEETSARSESEKKVLVGEKHNLELALRSKDEQLGGFGDDIQRMETCIRSLSHRFGQAQGCGQGGS
eukprot:gene25715-11372_t